MNIEYLRALAQQIQPRDGLNYRGQTALQSLESECAALFRENEDLRAAARSASPMINVWSDEAKNLRGWLNRIVTAAGPAEYLRELAYAGLEGRDYLAFEPVGGPWSVETDGERWGVGRGPKRHLAPFYEFATEAEAVAVRDALNRVASSRGEHK